MKERIKTDNSIFRERLKSLMKEKGFTQRSLSAYTKTLDEKDYISATTLALWSTGDSFPNSTKMKTLSDIFEVSPNYLYGWDTKAPDRNSVDKIEALYTYLHSIGIEDKMYSEPIEQPKVRDVVIGDKQSYSVSYSYKNMTVEYFDFENDELIQNIENAILNLIFSYQARNKGESKNGSN